MPVYRQAGGFQVAPVIKNPSPMQETEMGVSLGREDPLQEEMALTLVFLPGESHGQRSLAAAVHKVAKSRTRMSD